MFSEAETQIKLILIYLLLIFGYTFTRGFYSFGGFLSILLAFFILLFLPIKPPQKLNQLSLLLFFTLFISLVLSFIFYGGLYQSNTFLIVTSQWISFFLIPLSFLYLKENPRFPTLNRYKFQIFIVVAFILRIFMIISSPHPVIDVFDQLQLGSKALLEGRNPYQLIYPVIYPNHKPVVYAYPPGSLIIFASISLFFSDPRTAHIISDLLAALILYQILKKTLIYSKYKHDHDDRSTIIELIPIIFLYNPMSLFVIEQSWIDPVLAFFIYLFTYYYLKKPNSLSNFIILGLSITIKHIALFLYPALLKLESNRKQLLITSFVVLALIIPFYLWSPMDFIFDMTITKQNQIYNTAPITQSLNFVGFFNNTYTVDIPQLVHILGFIFFAIIAFKITKKSLIGFLHNFVIVTFSATLFFTQAFLNYYTFISSLIILFMSVSFYQSNMLKNKGV